MSGDVLIEARGLRKSYGALRAVDGIDLHVRRGEIVGFLGPNGAGKTTTVEILEGLRRRDDGEARVLGCDVGRLDPVRPRIGALTQNGTLSDNVAPIEHAQFYSAIYPGSSTAEELLARVGLTDMAKTRFGRLSGGQKQRLKVALALIGKPEVVFLDEPSGELDPQARRLVWDLILDPDQRSRRAMVLTTHQMEEAASLCDRVYIIDHGRIAAEGTPDELIARHAPTQRILYQSNDGPREITTQNLEKSLAELFAAGDVVRDLRIIRATLEDVFFALTGNALRD